MPLSYSYDEILIYKINVYKHNQKNHMEEKLGDITFNVVHLLQELTDILWLYLT